MEELLHIASDTARGVLILTLFFIMVYGASNFKEIQYKQNKKRKNGKNRINR